jgi:flavodoxin
MLVFKWLSISVGSILALAILQAIVVTSIESYQLRKNELLLAQATKPASQHHHVAVVYFSRSGNTALMAQRIALRLNASLFKLEAPDYRIGMRGWINALADAKKHEATIEPQAIDLSAFDTVYLGSPVWMYSPAPPIWDFVEHNRFDNKHVVLFNTFNSRFKAEYIETFKAKVMQKGARSFERRSINRGRIGRQLSSEELLQAVEEQWPLSGE